MKYGGRGRELAGGNSSTAHPYCGRAGVLDNVCKCHGILPTRVDSPEKKKKKKKPSKQDLDLHPA